MSGYNFIKRSKINDGAGSPAEFTIVNYRTNYKIVKKIKACEELDVRDFEGIEEYDGLFYNIQIKETGNVLYLCYLEKINIKKWQRLDVLYRLIRGDTLIIFKKENIRSAKIKFLKIEDFIR